MLKSRTFSSTESQIVGVAIGSPLGPLFANVFMSDFERKHMSSLKERGVKLWLRYVDDVT